MKKVIFTKDWQGYEKGQPLEVRTEELADTLINNHKVAKEAKGKDGDDFVSAADKRKLEEAKDKK